MCGSELLEITITSKFYSHKIIYNLTKFQRLRTIACVFVLPNNEMYEARNALVLPSVPTTVFDLRSESISIPGSVSICQRETSYARTIWYVFKSHEKPRLVKLDLPEVSIARFDRFGPLR